MKVLGYCFSIGSVGLVLGMLAGCSAGEIEDERFLLSLEGSGRATAYLE
jgi:hypothetical protein